MTGAREQSTRGGQTRSEGKGGETGRGGRAGLLARFETVTSGVSTRPVGRHCLGSSAHSVGAHHCLVPQDPKL